MISNFFIDRPLFACVVSAFIVIAGLVALRSLTISLYPDILPPMVEVQTSLSGRPPEVSAETVAAPLEQQINGAEDMIYLRSGRRRAARSRSWRASRSAPIPTRQWSTCRTGCRRRSRCCPRKSAARA